MVLFLSKISLPLWMCLFVVIGFSEGGLTSVEEAAAAVKARLARLIFQKDAAFLEATNVSLDVLEWTKKTDVDSVHSGLFRSAESDDHYVISGKTFSSLNLHGGSVLSPIRLDYAKALPEVVSPVVSEVKTWSGTFYMVCCELNGICQVSTAASGDVEFTPMQFIRLKSTPVQAKVFEHEGGLLLALVSDSTSIYRWSGTYFDEIEDSFALTLGAKTIEIFKDDQRTIISLNGKESTSVYLLKNHTIQPTQNLYVKNQIGLMHYGVPTKHGVQNFLIALSNSNESQIFWWNQKRFSAWSTLENLGHPENGFAGTIASQPFVFIVCKKNVHMYHATPTELTLKRTVQVDGDVLKMSLDGSKMLLLIEKRTGGRQIAVLEFRVKTVPIGQHDERTTVKCMRDLVEKIKVRDSILNATSGVQNKIIHTDKNANIEYLSVRGQATFNDVAIKKMNVLANGRKLLTTPTKLTEKVEGIRRSVDLIRTKSAPKDNYLIEGDLVVEKMTINNLEVETLNERRMDQILSISKNQTFLAPVRGEVISAKKFEADVMNSKQTAELLLREKNKQKITGAVFLAHLHANDLKFTEDAKINGIPFEKFANKDTKVIAGVKTVDTLVMEKLIVSNINKVHSSTWLSALKPPELDPVGSSSYLDVKSLKLDNLTVEYVNGIPWTEVSAKISSAERNRRINNLKTNSINGIPVKNLLTKTGDQTITSKVTVDQLFALKLRFKKLNNATVMQVAENMRNIFFGGDNETLEVRIDRPVKVSGDFRANRFEFRNSTETKTNRKLMDTAPNGESEIGAKETSSEETLLGYVHDQKKVDRIVIRGDLKVRNKLKAAKINGDDVEPSLSEILLLDERNNLQDITFDELSVARIFCDTLNGVPIEDVQYMRLIVNGTLSLPGVFLKASCSSDDCPVKLRNILVDGHLAGEINGRNFSYFASNLFSRTKDQNITGNFSFNTINTNFLNVATVNDVSTDNLLFANGIETLTIHSPVEFQNLVGFQNVTLDQENCDLSVLSKTNLSETSHFDSIEAVGNITWSLSNSEYGPLSHIINDAVTYSANPTILAEVTFKKDVSVDSLRTKKHLNDVDLKFIAKDAVLSSVPVQRVTANFLLENVTADSVTVKSNIVVDKIDDIDIVAFNASLVRRSEEKLILGRKIFSNGFSTYGLNVTGRVHGVEPDQIVFQEDFIDFEGNILSETEFSSLRVLSSFNTTTFNGENFNEFVECLVSLSANETLGPFSFEGSLKIGNLNVSKVNDLLISDIVLRSEENQTIHGDLEFSETLEIPSGEYKSPIVNGIDLMDKYEKSIKIDENSSINGNLVIEGDLTITGNLESPLIGECRVRDLYTREREFDPKYIVSENNQATAEELKRISEIVQNRKTSKIFKYLDNYKTVEFNLTNVQSTSAINYDENTAHVQVNGMGKGDCGLPSSCLCPVQYSVVVNAYDITVEKRENRTFFFYDQEMEVSVRVTTNSRSYSTKCQISDKTERETTEIEWERKGNLTSEPTILEEGYLSDVKFFKLGDSVFIVMAFLFDGNSTARPRVLVYELQAEVGILSEIDSIQAEGAMTLDVVWASPSYVLVIGNIRTENAITDSAYTDVYIFRERTNKFEKLKSIHTHSVVGLKTARILKDSFIFIVQKYPWPLVAYKYNSEQEKYNFSDKLHPNVGFYSVNALPLSESGTDDVYIGVVSVNDVFTILRYKNVEGLVEVVSLKQKDVQNLQILFVGENEFLLAASPSGMSSIYRVISQKG